MRTKKPYQATWLIAVLWLGACAAMRDTGPARQDTHLTGFRPAGQVANLARAADGEEGAAITAVGHREAAAAGNRGVQRKFADVLGDWKGAIVVADTSIYLTIHLDAVDGELRGHLNIPEIGAQEEPLSEILREGKRLRFALPGEPVPGVFETTLAGERMQGRFTYLDLKGAFWAERIEGTSPRAKSAYREEEIELRSQDVALAGTLTLPKSRGRHPAVVLVSAAGPKDRRAEIAGFPLFQVLAHHLTRAGFAVLRMDDRGSGESTGRLADATREELAGDVQAAVDYLQQRKDIASQGIGLLGFGEGGLVVPEVARENRDVAFVVLLGGSALSGERVLLEQSATLLEGAGFSADEVEKQLDFQKKILRHVRANAGWEELEATLFEMLRDEMQSLPVEERGALGDAELWARLAAKEQIDKIQSPWFRSFLEYDPGPVLTQIDVPVLAVFGGLDRQLVVAEHARAMRQAFAKNENDDTTIAVIPGANHLMQAAKTGQMDEYLRLEPAFEPAFTQLLIRWLDERTLGAKKSFAEKE